MSEAADHARAAEASRWFTVVTNPSISVQDLHRFRDWRADPDNAAAFEKVERMWGRTQLLSDRTLIKDATADVLARYPVRLPKTEFKLRPLITATAVTIALATTSALAVFQPWWPTYSTSVGAQRLEQLADGSRVRLNTDTRLQVRFTEGARHIRLLKGEAYFEVAHDTARPFVVEADDARVRAIGTKFAVHRDADQVAVTLLQGRVEVRETTLATATTLAPGQSLTVTSRGMSRPRSVDTADVTDWTTGQLNFSGVPLRAAVAEMNRYTSRKIVLDPSVQVDGELVSGRFEAGDTANFLAALDAVYGLKVTRTTNREIRLAPG